MFVNDRATAVALVICLVALPGVAVAQPQQQPSPSAPLGLRAAVDLALRNHPVVRESRAGSAAAAAVALRNAVASLVERAEPAGRYRSPAPSSPVPAPRGSVGHTGGLPESSSTSGGGGGAAVAGTLQPSGSFGGDGTAGRTFGSTEAGTPAGAGSILITGEPTPVKDAQ